MTSESLPASRHWLPNRSERSLQGIASFWIGNSLKEKFAVNGALPLLGVLWWVADVLRFSLFGGSFFHIEC